MQLPDKLLQLRKEHNLSQDELASQLHISRQSISLWEKGETMPSIDNLLLLKSLYNISLDQWLANDSCPHNMPTTTHKKLTTRQLAIMIVSLVLIVALLSVGIITLVSRHNTLYPLGADTQLTYGAPLYTSSYNSTDTATLLYSQDNAPLVYGVLPEGYTETTLDGVYSDDNGNYVKITSQYADNVVNPLTGSYAYSYLYSRGITTTLEMYSYALYYDLSATTILSPYSEIELASGIRILRSYLCWSDASCSRVYGDMGGLAIHMQTGTWLVILKDADDNIYEIVMGNSYDDSMDVDTVMQLVARMTTA